MTAEEALNSLASWTVLYVGVVLLLFIIIYAGFFNWRKTSGGRSVMYFVCSLELLIFLAAFRRWFPEALSDETQQFLAWEVYLAIAGAATRMLYVLVTRWKTTGTVSIDVDLRNRERSTKS